MDALLNLVEKGNEFLMSYFLVVVLFGTGIYYTIRLRFIQVRRFKEGFKLVFGNFNMNGEKHEKGEMTPFQSVATAIAAQVGTGNLAGAATALIGGGPGAIFWMWLSAFFGMATIYAEAVLAQQYKTEVDGEVTGGPVYYIKAAFKGTFGRVLAGLFAVFIILALGFMGNMVQSNSIGAAFSEVFSLCDLNVPPVAVGAVIAALSLVIFLGGTKRLAAVVEKLVPIMACFYLAGGLIIVLMNFQNIPYMFASIIEGAFNPRAVCGGAFGVAMKEAVKKGVARGLFSNEAGMGSTPNAHAQANVAHPCQQGQVAIVSVFIDTILVLNMTAFVIIGTKMLEPGSPAYVDGKLLDGIALTQTAFNSAFGSFGSIFIAICMLFFAFSTILGWYFFGETNVKYLFGEKAVKPYIAFVCLFIVLGSLMKVSTIWNMSDCFNSLMVVPNVIGLFALTGVVKKTYKDYRTNFLPNHPEDESR